MSMASSDETILMNDPTAAQAARPLRFGFSNTYARLPERFHSRCTPTKVAAPRLLKLNRELAIELGLDPEVLATDDGVAVLSGNAVAEGSEPLAIAYAGHQFGNFVPQLGDGRANLIGEVVAADGRRFDVQLKGSGPTPFSRRGDGRAGIGPVLREYIVSEAMAALGVPTTRALAAVATGETVWREGPQPGAVLTRVAASHLRVGTFEYFSVRQDVEGLRVLADYAIERHYPEAANAERPYRALLEGVIRRQAELVARWMHLGFVHGVMNTDNTSISGETLDFGPCAFLEAYDPETVFSSIDRQGRYAYGNQPGIAFWNLTRLAEALLPLLVEVEGTEARAIEQAGEALQGFAGQFETAERAGWRRKIGLDTEQASDAALIGDLLARMAANRVDFTLFFRRLCDAAASPAHDAAVRELWSDPAAFDGWAASWRRRLADETMTPEARSEAMRAVNPAIIPRNHRVEEALQAAAAGDLAPLEALLDATRLPYADRPEMQRYTAPARPEEAVRWTFCGT